MQTPTAVVIIGMTGSGKTTLAQALEAKLKLPRFSAGDIARSMAETDPDTEVALRSGAYAPEDAIRHQVRQRIEMAEISDGGWILEGFPRKVEQLIELMRWRTLPIGGSLGEPLYIYLEIPPYVAVQRLMKRGRPDDNGDSIARKLRNFENETLPVVNMLEHHAKLLVVDAEDLDAAIRLVESHIDFNA